MALLALWHYHILFTIYIHFKYQPMNEHRFILQPYKGRNTRHECPSCNKKQCFTRYIDTTGAIQFPTHVGRCDHENSCGYHYTPRQYFEDTPSVAVNNGQNAKVPKVPRTKVPEIEPYFFDAVLMARTEKAYDTQALCIFLSGILGMERTTTQMKLYHAGTSRDDSTAFWQVDFNGQIRTCKIIRYDRGTGHRLKAPEHHPYWLHTMMKIDKQRIRQCFFGEHLINKEENRGKPVAIVESEKTAIVASLYIRDFVWIATGGSNGMFNRADLNVLRSRKVILVPDLGMYDSWHDKAITLTRLGIDASVYDFLEKNASEADNKAGLDIADFLLQQRFHTGTTIGAKETVNGTIEDKRHYRNPECHACGYSQECINGTYCGKLKRYVEYGKGDCGL